MKKLSRSAVIKRKVLSIISKYGMDESFKERDRKVFEYLLVMYDMGYQDVGKEITNIKRVYGPIHHEKTIEATYSDGTTDIVGFRQIGVKPRRTKEQEFKYNLLLAMRMLICPVHVAGKVAHHAGRTFKDLSESYLKDNMPSKDILVPCNGNSYALRDCEWTQNWFEYHADNADIVYLTPEEHKEAHHGY